MRREIIDSQYDDAHRILVNRLGILNADELEPHIARLSYMRVAELEEKPLPGKFDIPHLRAIHRHIFQDVFPWAGDFREVMTSRTKSFGFPPPIYIEPSLHTLFTQLKQEDHLRKLSADAFVTRAAHYMGELNAVHPFREGNGRTQREFIRTLGLHAGHRISWRNITKDENDHASRISFAKGDHSGLAAIIRKCLV